MKCELGCACKRHQNTKNFNGNSSNPCEVGCTCKRHTSFRTNIGQTFDRWTVIETGLMLKAAKATRVLCACGNENVVAETRLIRGKSKSCGCLQKETRGKLSRTHGLSKHPLYGKWKAMMQRCYGTSHPQYKDWGGRGIVVCNRWHDPSTFIADIERSIGLCPPDMSLDRINNELSYELGNVRWATSKEQQNNQRKDYM